MARRSARRTYVRDGRGRFASTGTTTAKAKPAARRAQRGTNRITRDNSGRITGVGKNGATARGGRLRTAAGNQRGAVLDRLKRAPMAGTVGRGGKVRGGVRGVAAVVKPRPAKRDAVQQARRALGRTLSKLENARNAQSEGRKAIEKMRKQGSAPEDRKTLSRKINRASKGIARLQDAALRYRMTLRDERNRKNWILASRTNKKAPDNKRTRTNKIRTQQRKIKYITKNQGFQAGRSERAKLRQMLGKPSIKRIVAGVALTADPAPVSRGRRKAMAAAAKPATPAKPTKPAKAPRAGRVKGPSKGERVLARIAQNFARASAESRSKKEERKLARTAAVAEMAQGRVSRMAVGKRDPAQQYTRAELLPQLNKSLKRPIPKRERKSTLNPDFTRGLRGIAEGGMTKLRAAARKQGKLTGSRAPKQLRSGRTAGTVRRPKGYAPPKAAKAIPKPTSRRMLRIKASGPAGKYKGAWNMPDFAKGPRSAGTVRRPKGYSPPKPQATSISSSVRNRAASAQRRRRNSILDRTRGTIGWRGRNSKENPRIRAVDTGMRQLALVGKPKKLKRYKPVK